MPMLLQIFWDVKPVFFEFGNFGIRFYSVLFAMGFVISYFIVRKMYRAELGNSAELDRLLIWVIAGGLLGARIFHCVFYDGSYYLSGLLPMLEILLPVSFKPEFSFIGYQGLASHGGAIGIIVSLLIFKKKSQMKSFFWLIDRVAVPTGFAGACIRFGNLMNSEIYGHCTDLPWGFVFVQNGDTCASHPTQIYEALIYIATSVVLLMLYRKERYRNARGFLLGVFLIMVFLSRFFMEFLKNNQVSFENTMTLNMGQLLSIPLVILGIVLVIVSLRQKTTPQTEPEISENDPLTHSENL